MNKQNSYWWLICQMILFCGLQCTLGFYVPGIAPVEFKKGDPVDVKAVKMTSPRTQLPYEYYSLPFCKPPGEITYKSLNLGEILRGDRIVNTPYNVRMLENVSCRFLCTSSISAAEAKEVINRIQESYSIHLLVDNLPSATKLHLLDSKTAQYTHGFPLGFSKENKFYIYNHLQFVIKYNSDDQDTFRVVGFEVEPLSLNPQFVEITNENAKECQLKSFTNAPQPMELKEEDMKIAFSYDIQWVSSPIRWASRWDSYLTMTDSDIHWFSIINSVVVIFFLSGILAMIMIRTLRKDIARYNRDDDEEESLEESGWKLVHGDVFRPPQYPLLLSATIGSGIQLFLMMLFTIFFAMLGMLSPASRGALMSAGIFTYVFMGMFAGFFSARIYKTVRGQQWKTAALWTAMLVPGIVMGIGFLLNFFIWGKRSSAAIPFTTMLALLCMWLGISLPLVFTGAYFGYRKNPYQQPVRTNQIPRAVPPQKWYHGLGFSVIVAGVLPFGALFIELFFIFTAIWERQFYYMFGFLFIVFIIMVISVSQISVVLVYFQLCSENYHWWWRSFITSGGSALYIFGYSIFYFYTKLEITDFVPTLLYFGYSFIMAFILFILTGTVGFYAAYSFVNKIYAAIKID